MLFLEDESLAEWLEIEMGESSSEDGTWNFLSCLTAKKLRIASDRITRLKAHRVSEAETLKHPAFQPPRAIVPEILRNRGYDQLCLTINPISQ